MATQDDVARDLAREFGEQYGDLDISEQLQAWVQQTYEEIVQTAEWFFKNGEQSVALSNGVHTYTLPATVSRVRDAQLTSPSRARLAYTPVERLVARGEDLAEAGTPKAWFYQGIDAASTAVKIRVWPVPNAGMSLTVYTLERPAALALNAQIPLPTEYLAPLREGVRAKIRYNDGDLNSAAASEQKMVGLLQILNARFSGPPGAPSRLGVKRMRGVHQNPVSVDGS